jgi:polyisoprenoid-binding protein YceI
MFVGTEAAILQENLMLKLRHALILSLAILAQGTLARAADFALTGENTKVEFTGKKKDGAHTGEFKKLTGTAKATGTDAATLALDVTIDIDSMVTDDAKLTAHLKAPDFFEVKKYPDAKFVSTSVAKEKESYVVKGKLTLHGKTNEVSFPAEIALAADSLKLTAKFSIDRTLWGISHGKGQIDDAVELKLSIATKK